MLGKTCKSILFIITSTARFAMQHAESTLCILPMSLKILLYFTKKQRSKVWGGCKHEHYEPRTIIIDQISFQVACLINHTKIRPLYKSRFNKFIYHLRRAPVLVAFIV